MTTGININETPIQITVGEVQGPAGPKGDTGPAGASGAAQNVTTIAAFQAVSFPAALQWVKTGGYLTLGDGGATDWRRVDAQPGHPLRVRSLDRFLSNGTVDNANGGWWEGFSQDGRFMIEQFGGGEGATLTTHTIDNKPAFDAFHAYCVYWQSQRIGGTGNACFELQVGPGIYYFSDTCDIQISMRIIGLSAGESGSNKGSYIVWPGDRPCFIVNGTNTTALNGWGTARAYGADGTHISGLSFQPYGVHTAADVVPLHPFGFPIWLRTRAHIEDCQCLGSFNGFIAVVASTGAGDWTAGNANEWVVMNCSATFCLGPALWCFGSDVNAGESHSMGAVYCGGGIRDDCFLGNVHYTPNTDNCGNTGPTTTYGYTINISSVVQYNGKRYAIRRADILTDGTQLTAAQTHPPSGTTSDNAYWYYIDSTPTNEVLWGEASTGGLAYTVVPGQESLMWTSNPASTPAVWGTGSAPSGARLHIDWTMASKMATGASPYLAPTGPYIFACPYSAANPNNWVALFEPYTEGGQLPRSHLVGKGKVWGGFIDMDPYSTWPQFYSQAGQMTSTRPINIFNSTTGNSSVPGGALNGGYQWLWNGGNQLTIDFGDAPVAGSSGTLTNKDIVWQENNGPVRAFFTGPSTSALFNSATPVPGAFGAVNLYVGLWLKLDGASTTPAGGNPGDIWLNYQVAGNNTEGGGSPLLWRQVYGGSYEMVMPVLSPVAVSSLPAASAKNKGARGMVTDSNATLAAGIGNIVANGGANIVPVYSDGTNWRIG